MRVQSGNVILADSNLKILALYRNVAEGEGQEPQNVGLQYSLECRQNFLGTPSISQDRVRAALVAAVKKATTTKTASSKATPKQVDILRKCLAVSITELPPILVEHILHEHDFDVTLKLETILESQGLVCNLTEYLQKAKDLVDSITSTPTCTGYIFAKSLIEESTQGNQNPSGETRGGLLYDDFHPFMPKKFEMNNGIEVLRFDGYNRTVDEFFSSLEGQRLESRLIEREAAAHRKLELAKKDQENRLKGLQDAQSQNFRKAAAIEANVERVQEAIDSINGLLDQGMDWVDIGKLVEREKKKKNYVATMICLPLNLAENAISIRLSEGDGESEDGDPFETDESGEEGEDPIDSGNNEPQNADKSITVEVLLNLSPWSNAREYYDQRKTAVVKEGKTQLQADKAIKSTEQKIKHDLKKALTQEKALLQPIRNLMWFEKFYWFISSDGYLIIGAKDSSQAEILYRRHLRRGDVYCHADAKNAAVVVIKNAVGSADAPVPPATLSQAGQFSICSSEAWDSKAGIGAWWVNANQVSKSSPTGDLLLPGNFAISGEKNFLPPGQLVLGLSLMFKISDESKANHTKHRIQEHAAAESVSEGNARTTSSRDDEGLSADVDGEHTARDSEAAEEEEEDVEDDIRGNPLQAQNQAKGMTHQNDMKTMNDEQIVRKAASMEGNNQNEQGIEAPDGTEAATETIEASTTPTITSVQALKGDISSGLKKPKRGQKNKARKIASRYKDQDQEDRSAAEALIGAAAGKQKAEAQAQAKSQREEEQKQEKARRLAQHERKQKEVAEHEEKRQAIFNGPEEDDKEDKPVSIDVLIGSPRPGDEIIEAVIMCAPWAALGRCKYKVKLQPGAVRKGKAVKEILERLRADAGRKGAVDSTSMDTEKMWPREVELIKAMKPEEMVNTVPAGRVRLIVAGGSSGNSASTRSSGGGKNHAKGGKKNK